MDHEKILILDFGSQYTQLIARRVRELNIYCEIRPYNIDIKITKDIKAIILSGSPFSVRDKESPEINLDIIKNKVPILGICYGAQYIVHNNGGEVIASEIREYGRANLTYVDNESDLFKNVSDNSQVWMSHGDTISKLPVNYKVIASTIDVEIAAYHAKDEDIYALQFHPEVYHTLDGKMILKNFLIDIVGCKQDWTSDSFINETIISLKERLGNDKVILGLSGGVDSTVASILLHKAIGKNLHCIFVDNGLLRKGEFESVLKQYNGMGLNVKGVDAKERFYDSLAGVVDPEEKRKIIGKEFVEVFDYESKMITGVKWLAQGTIYPDVIESVSATGGPSSTIKSHHNVGGLPDFMKLNIVEPLSSLFKDEVRKIGLSLGINSQLIARHPFPGPGLAIRIIGKINNERLHVLREADNIFLNILQDTNEYDNIWQAFCVLLPLKTVGVMGDKRTYENVICLRMVTSLDGMTADWFDLPADILKICSNRIVNEVTGVNRVVVDVTSKPPGTIEWE